MDVTLSYIPTSLRLQIFSDVAKRRKGKVNVFFCGAPLLATTLKSLCEKYDFQFFKEEF